MALTRRFFAALASDFKAARPANDETPNERAVWEQMVRLTAHALASQNGMFNYAKFYEACGMSEEVVAVARG